MPLNKPTKLHLLIIRSAFSEDGKFYPQLFLNDALTNWENAILQKIDVSEGIDVNKTSGSKRC